MAAREDDLYALHYQLAVRILEKVNDPEATSKDFKLAADFLRDNGFTIGERDDLNRDALGDLMQSFLKRGH